VLLADQENGPGLQTLPEAQSSPAVGVPDTSMYSAKKSYSRAAQSLEECRFQLSGSSVDGFIFKLHGL